MVPGKVDILVIGSSKTNLLESGIFFSDFWENQVQIFGKIVKVGIGVFGLVILNYFKNGPVLPWIGSSFYLFY
jgi:hypothetical protein